MFLILCLPFGSGSEEVMVEAEAITLNPSIPDFRYKGYTIPSLLGFVGDDEDEMRLCKDYAVKCYVSRKQSFMLACQHIFFPTGRVRKIR